MIDFLACNGLFILNRCTVGDIFRELTSVDNNGASVVDYMAATRPFDHRPCLCKVARKHKYVDADVPKKGY